MSVAPQPCYYKLYAIKIMFFRAEINLSRASADMDLGFCLKTMSKDVCQRMGGL